MFRKKTGIFFLFFALAVPTIGAAQSTAGALSSQQTQIGEALVSIGMQIEKTALDCSHFVSSIFQQAGLSYKYEPSQVLYKGTSGFKRVYHPIAGDLIVWPGHVGMVVDPEGKTFLSKLSHGVKVSSYTSQYWRGRGHPRYFRYALPIPDSTLLASGVHTGQSLDGDGLE